MTRNDSQFPVAKEYNDNCTAEDERMERLAGIRRNAA
jgi:hypothetical protein